MKSMIAAVAALAGIASVANAAMLFSTDFNAPTYTDGALIGQDGWVLTNSTLNPLAVANSATNGTVSLTTAGQDVRRVFSPAVTIDSVYLTATFTVGAAQAAGDYFIHLGDGGTSNFYARIYAKSTTGGFLMAMGTSAGTATYGTTVLPYNTSITLLARYDFVAGAANDTGALFINPTNAYGIGDTAYVAATTIGTDATTISSVSLRQGAAANAASVVVDSLSVATIPTPGSVALLGLAGLVAGRRRR